MYKDEKDEISVTSLTYGPLDNTREATSTNFIHKLPKLTLKLKFEVCS